MRIVILLLLVVVLGSLFSGLYFVYKDKGSTNRAVIALAVGLLIVNALTKQRGQPEQRPRFAFTAPARWIAPP